MIPEDVIRQRSYEIWEREGCPEGKSDEHWLRARHELEGEFRMLASAPAELRNFVMPRLPMTRPPQRMVSVRITATGVPIAARR